MQPPKIALAALGGTICMTPAASGGVTPSLSAHDLLQAVPSLTDHAELQAETLFSLPSSAIDFAVLQRVLAWANQQIQQGADGIVITQGTDSMEESAFFLDLLWPHPQPLVFTGAMRSPNMPGADGPANLLSAVITAAHPKSQQRGVLLVMNDTVHAARQVRKAHTLAVEAFVSTGSGPLACLVEGQVRWLQARAHRPAPLPLPQHRPLVALLETCLGDTGELLPGVLAAGFQGLVLSGFGTGHVAPAFAERLDAICAAMPVIMASRTGSGYTTRATYGAIGSEIDLQARGVLMAENLDARKARLLLWTLLAGGVSPTLLPVAWRQWLAIEY